MLIIIFMLCVAIPTNSAQISELYDSDEEVAHDISKKFNTEIERVRALMLISSAEKASSRCNFRLTNHFNYVKREIMKSKLDSKIYNYLSNMQFQIQSNMMKYWCEGMYDRFGSKRNSNAFFQ